MDKRTKIMAGLFGVVITYVMISRIVYPLIEPVLGIEQRIADKRKDYEELSRKENEVNQAVEQYRDWVNRNGTMDVSRVEREVVARLNALIAKHKLDVNSITPGRPSTDRKTKLSTWKVTVSATGTLQAAIEFLKDVSEMPYVMRVGNAAIYPASRSKKQIGPSLMTMRFPLELRVIPKQRLVKKLKEDELVQPDVFVRHADRDYSRIWSRKPFTEPIPLRVDAGRTVKVVEGQKASLRGTASGGDRRYTCTWTPSDRLSDPNSCTPTLDTTIPTKPPQIYTLLVRDGSGESATDTVRVTITERRRPKRVKLTEKTTKPKPRLKPKPVDPQWKDGRYIQVRMALRQSAGGNRTDELMVYNNKKKKSLYYAVGDDFDGGKLVYVHPHGGIVRRKGDFFLYPLGEWVDREFLASAKEADAYPDLRYVADQVRAVMEASEAKEEEAAIDPKDLKSLPNAKPEKGADKPVKGDTSSSLKNPHTVKPASGLPRKGQSNPHQAKVTTPRTTISTAQALKNKLEAARNLKKRKRGNMPTRGSIQGTKRRRGGLVAKPAIRQPGHPGTPNPVKKKGEKSGANQDE